MKKIVIISISILIGLCGFGQSKTQIKENNITSSTVWKYEYSGGKETKIKESYTAFNNQGLIIEEIDFDKEGLQKERVVISYNDLNNKIEEQIFDKSNKLINVVKYSYKDELKIAKEVFDNKGKLLSKKVYDYETN